MPTSKKTDSGSITNDVYGRIRSAIVSGSLRPGQRLKISELGQLMQANLSAVREALSRLSSEDLVTATAQKGFCVASVSLIDLNHLTSTRILVETACLRRALELRSIDWETRVVGAFHRLSRFPERSASDPSKISDLWAEAHSEFHQTLVSTCDNNWLLRLRSTLFTHSERYRRISVSCKTKTRDLLSEHAALKDAVLSNDVELACRLIASHFSLTAELVESLVQGEVRSYTELAEVARGDV